MLNVQVATGDGTMGAYVAMPKDVSGPAPAVVILMEVFGVNRFIRRIADHWAEQGLIVLAPDLYWRIRPGIELDPETDGHRDQALKTREGMDVDLAAKDVEACVAHLRGMSECSGKVATSGYCPGRVAGLSFRRAWHCGCECQLLRRRHRRIPERGR